MKVLIACEESQTVCKEFRKLGHEAYSCDLQDCSGGHPEWHIKGNAIHQLYKIWDLVIAHPTCTRICNSGVSWLEKRNLWDEMYYACEFFNQFQDYAKREGVKVCIENPIPHKYAVEYIGKYTQLIQPWMFGHGETKATCLWLYGLPKLTYNLEDNLFGSKTAVEGREQRLHKLPPSPDRAKLRSKTYSGIAEAMAVQWGCL